MKTSLALAGFGATAVVAGVALLSVPLALIVFGVTLVGFALFREGGA